MTAQARAPRDELQTIPGVGPSLAQDLRDLGIARVDDLRGQSPQRLYDRLVERRGTHQDRCVLYVFRCAVYFAETAAPEPALLKWWAWKDTPLTAPLYDALDGPDGRPVRIRPAVEEDAAPLLAYYAEVGGESPYLTFGAEGPGRDETTERAFLAGARASDNQLALVAEWDGGIVACLTFRGGERARIRHVGEFGISIARVCQGLGLGRRLLEHLLGWAERGGVVRKINLRVRVDNARAIALYESLGFAVEGRATRDTLIDGVFHDTLVMGRAIDPAR
jgi:RimJ/RimL family protein N-acetyltransferase